MSQPPCNGNGREPVTPFNYDAILNALDGVPPPDVDKEFWTLESELLRDLLRWMLEAQNLAHVGARVTLLVLYLRPEMLRISSLRELSKMENAPSCASLSKCLIELQEKFDLRPSPIQKPGWSRERYRRSALIGHQNRAQ